MGFAADSFQVAVDDLRALQQVAIQLLVRVARR